MFCGGGDLGHFGPVDDDVRGLMKRVTIVPDPRCPRGWRSTRGDRVPRSRALARQRVADRRPDRDHLEAIPNIRALSPQLVGEKEFGLDDGVGQGR